VTNRVHADISDFIKTVLAPLLAKRVIGEMGKEEEKRNPSLRQNTESDDES